MRQQADKIDLSGFKWYGTSRTRLPSMSTIRVGARGAFSLSSLQEPSSMTEAQLLPPDPSATKFLPERRSLCGFVENICLTNTA